MEIERTIVLYGEENATRTILEFVANAKDGWDSYIDTTGLSVSVGIGEVRDAIAETKKKGLKIRAITEITSDNVSYCKEYIQIIGELRHLDGVKGNFNVSQNEYVATATLREAQPVPQVIYSNVKDIVEEHHYLFETLWLKAVAAQQKIKELEEGIEREFFEVITDGEKVIQILLDLTKSARKEMLLLLPVDKAMVRIDRLGIFDNLIKVSNENNAIIKIICPLSEANSQIVRKITESAPSVMLINGNSSEHGIYIVDKEKLLRTELVNPYAESFSEAINLAIYSNSKRSVELFRSMFELLWKERQLNEELKKIDIMQKEFINVAAHELRTPTQAIISYSRLLQQHPEKSEEIIKAINRNGDRLQRLTSDILYVTRIESHTLILDKEQFDLGEKISSVINDITRSHIKNENKNVRISFNEPKKPITIKADRVRIYEVISNVLTNALKFTKKGTITVTTELVTGNPDDNNATNNKRYVIVSIKDTGSGIDPELRSKLFTKFVTKSESGTGLGLFISKSIVEAHGGKIWAENNREGRGATFAFSLPLNEIS
jgi:two-component system sensor histidine kinase VicK